MVLGMTEVPLAHNLFCIVAKLISGSRRAVEVDGGVLGGWPDRNADHSAALESLIVPPAIKCCGGVLGGWPNGLGVLEAGGGMWEGWSDGLGAAAVVTLKVSGKKT